VIYIARMDDCNTFINKMVAAQLIGDIYKGVKAGMAAP